MCLAIYKPENEEIDEAYLRQGMEENPNGAGFAVADGKQLIVRKGFFSWKSFIRAWRQMRDIGPALVHFRWATHGEINQSNCHPFVIGKEYAVIHNGVLDWASTKTQSDTACFVRQLLAPQAKRRSLHDADLVKHLGQLVGKTNKLCFLSPDGSASIVNEGAGHWNNGVWFSNYCYYRLVGFDRRKFNLCASPVGKYELDLHEVQDMLLSGDMDFEEAQEWAYERGISTAELVDVDRFNYWKDGDNWL